MSTSQRVSSGFHRLALRPVIMGTSRSLVLAAVLLGLTALAPAHAAPFYYLTGGSLRVLCKPDRPECAGIVFLFHDLISAGMPIDGRRLCWPGDLSVHVVVKLISAEMEAANAQGDYGVFDENGFKVLADLFERHFPCNAP